MILKHRDRELLRFDWVEPQGVRVVSVNEAERQFLPLEMKSLGARASSPRSDTPLGARASSPRSEAVVTDESLWAWLRRRTVPKNRHYVDAMLGHLGIRQKDTRAIIELCRGLSLNDVYWVVPDDFTGRWRDFNLYENESDDNSRYDDFADLRKFIARVSPALYDDWLSFPGGVTDEMKQRLTRLKGFRFKRHKYYNLPAARLKIIEDFIQKRVGEVFAAPCRTTTSTAPCRSADGPSATPKAVDEGGGVPLHAAPCRSADGPSATPKAVDEGGGVPSPTRIFSGQREADEPSALRQTKEPLWHSRGYLPHVENKALQFITYRLFDSVPNEVVEQWRTELGISENVDANAPECQELRRRIERYADAGHGSCLLADARVAAMIQENLLHFNGERYRLIDWCIMPNHVHVLIEVAEGWTVSKIVQGWRSYTAHEANRILGRTGRFWQPEYFDRHIRNERHLADTIAYIDTNPDKVGLKDWKWRAPCRSALPATAPCRSADGPSAAAKAVGGGDGVPSPAAPCRSADGPSATSKAVGGGDGVPLPTRIYSGQREADEPSALRQKDVADAKGAEVATLFRGTMP